MTRILATLLLIGLSVTCYSPLCHAEGLTLAQFSYEIVPSAELDLTGVEEEELQSRAETYTTKFAVPILLNGTETMLINFVTLRLLHQSFQDEAPVRTVLQPENLYSIKYGLVFRRVINSRWTFAALVQPVLLSDFRDIGLNHFRLRGGFLFERRTSPRFKYAFGVGFSDDYGDEKVLPVVQLSWEPTTRWSVRFDVPQKLNIWYQPHPRWGFGMLAKVTGAHFRIGETVELVEKVITDDGRVKYSILNVGPAMRVNVFDNVHFVVNGGRSLFRRFEIFDDQGRQLEDSNFENSFFIKFFLQYNIEG